MRLGKTKRNPVVESDIIVAMLDTGIDVDVPSFNDEGFSSPPLKFKGECQTGANFTGCNNKVIGAKAYSPDLGSSGEAFTTPADYDGHGTHTSSTAAGSIVKGTSFYGMAKGTARGGVPGARIAMYKVCGSGQLGCLDADILSGFDDAIADGADLISISLGRDFAVEFEDDAIAIGSFHAMQKGMLVVAAAGNGGPTDQSVVNIAPWMLTVAASNIDREFRTVVKLGNGFNFYGRSINTFAPNKTIYPLTSGALATAPQFDPSYGSTCETFYLLPSKVEGKILLCDDYVDDRDVAPLGALGTILAYKPQYVDVAFLSLLPETIANHKTGSIIERYINETKEPTAVIDKSITMKVDAPFVASFSARGPQFMAPSILKPDIIAPGLDILAGYSKYPSLYNGSPLDKRHQVFTVMSGTSMATPHVAGAAAYVKSFHPDWSPAAIMSALMTTAKPMYVEGVEHPFQSGSGLLNPTAAIHPGLIYNMSLSSHISYLCRQGYNGTKLGLITGDKIDPDCKDYPKAKGTDGINYPSLHLQFSVPEGTGNFSGTFYRTVTSVTPGKSTYKSIVHGSERLSVKVVPDTLVFNKQHEEKSFKVIVSGTLDYPRDWVSTVLEWKDARHKVRTPIVIFQMAV